MQAILLKGLFFFLLGPPPSYQSLFGEIQGARESSSSSLDFLKKLILLLAGTSKYSCVHRVLFNQVSKVTLNRPVPSYPLPLFQNESTCETIHRKMSFTFTSIFMQTKVIFISMVLHVGLF